MCSTSLSLTYLFFFFNDTATTEIYTLSLHDALPISAPARWPRARGGRCRRGSSRGPPAHVHGRGAPRSAPAASTRPRGPRSEEHTSELQSPCNLVCRLLLEKKKTHNLPHNV